MKNWLVRIAACAAELLQEHSIATVKSGKQRPFDLDPDQPQLGVR